MGQKVNPTGFRVGITEDWKSRWYAPKAAYGNFLVLVLGGVSGCLMPRSWQPELMQRLGLATPHAWALIAYDQLLNQEEPHLALAWRCIAHQARACAPPVSRTGCLKKRVGIRDSTVCSGTKPLCRCSRPGDRSTI